MSPEQRDRRHWWSDVELEPGASAQWRIGPLTLRLERSGRELRVGSRRGNDPLDESLSFESPAPEQDEQEDVELRRFALRRGRKFHLRPRTPDRPLVVKPAAPFGLPSKEEVTLYVSSAVWVELRVDSGLPLMAEPTFRASDTWFGATTREGELCYASKTSAHLDLETLPLRPHRAVTAVRIHNLSSELLWLERLKIPLTNLSVFASDEARLWTETLELEHRRPGSPAEATVRKQPPSEAGRTRRLAEPPQPITRGFVLDAFGGLFGRREKEDDERVDRRPGSSVVSDP